MSDNKTQRPDQALLERAADNSRRVFDLGNVAYAIGQRTHHRAALAAAQFVQAHYPQAAKLTFHDGDDYADRRWHPYQVVAADDTVLEHDLRGTAIYEQIEAVASGLVYSEAAMSADFEVSTDSNALTLTMDIDLTLEARDEPYDRASSIERIDPFIKGYAAAHSDEDLSSSIQDLLTDLRHWSQEHDVDPDQAMRTAALIAADESEEWTLSI